MHKCISVHCTADIQLTPIGTISIEGICGHDGSRSGMVGCLTPVAARFLRYLARGLVTSVSVPLPSVRSVQCSVAELWVLRYLARGLVTSVSKGMMWSSAPFPLKFYRELYMERVCEFFGAKTLQASSLVFSVWRLVFTVVPTVGEVVRFVRGTACRCQIFGVLLPVLLEHKTVHRSHAR
jgi:hypothetical protein